MAHNLITPKYLTREIAQEAVALVVYAVMGSVSPFRSRLKRFDGCHIAILVPGMDDDDRVAVYPECPNELPIPVMLYEHSVGEPSLWPVPFARIARSKAMQLWGDQNDDHTGVMPHLLFKGDTYYWGGVKRKGIVIACSGVQSWFDKMIAGMVADAIIALAHDAYENDPDRKDGVHFVS